MIEMAIRFVLGNLTSMLFAGALGATIFAKRPPCYGARLLNWLLLLSAGIGGLCSRPSCPVAATPAAVSDHSV